MTNIKMLAAASASALLLAACATKTETAEIADESAVVASEDLGTAKSGNVEGDDMATLGERRTVQPAANLGDRVYFDLNGNALDVDDQAVLSAHAQKYAANPQMRILVAGNCDERGTREYNLALGERRAEAVKSYLVSLGIDGSRIDTISYGKERPIAGGSNEEAWATNRNGFIQVVNGQTG